uniref:Uncharacterized protein n=1 Tax=Romanomermis culicivorax TaxID=13658 RepID=A0A915JX47_ROMCU
MTTSLCETFCFAPFDDESPFRPTVVEFIRDQRSCRVMLLLSQAYFAMTNRWLAHCGSLRTRAETAIVMLIKNRRLILLTLVSQFSINLAETLQFSFQHILLQLAMINRDLYTIWLAKEEQSLLSAHSTTSNNLYNHNFGTLLRGIQCKTGDHKIKTNYKREYSITTKTGQGRNIWKNRKKFMQYILLQLPMSNRVVFTIWLAEAFMIIYDCFQTYKARPTACDIFKSGIIQKKIDSFTEKKSSEEKKVHENLKEQMRLCRIVRNRRIGRLSAAEISAFPLNTILRFFLDQSNALNSCIPTVLTKKLTFWHNYPTKNLHEATFDIAFFQEKAII